MPKKKKGGDLCRLSRQAKNTRKNRAKKSPEEIQRDRDRADIPKRPLSAYMLWLASAREQIKKENPGIKVTEVAKKGGEIWRGMKDKSEWEVKVAQAKEDYEEACRQYDANGGLPSSSGKKRSKPAKKGAKKSKKADSEDEEEEESD